VYEHDVMEHYDVSNQLISLASREKNLKIIREVFDRFPIN
jgi:hypothetical protein